jgi:hypothetical protein
MVQWNVLLRGAVRRSGIVLASLAFAAISSQAQAVFSAPAQVSADMNATGEPEVAVAPNNTIYVVWSDQASACTASGCNKDVFFSRSVSGGAFSTPVNLSNNGTAGNPQIAVGLDGSINIAWSGGGLLDFTRSTDAGTTFSSPLNIAGVTNPSLSFTAAGYHSLVVDASGNIDIVWPDSNSSQVYFARSTNTGVSFSSPLNISNYSSGASSPTLAVDPTGIDVVWQGSVSGHNPYDLFFTRSTDGGASFSVAKDISNAVAGAYFDQIGVEPGGNIDVAWNSNCPSPSFCTVVSSDVFFARSTDAGATFSAPVQLTNTQGQGAISRVLLAIDASGNINLAWPEVTGGNNTAFFSRMNAGSSSFSSPQQIASAFPAAMVVDAGGNIDVAAASTDVYVLRSTNAGATFSSTNITNGGTGDNPEDVELVLAANSPGGMGVGWPSYNQTSSKWDIFASTSTVQSSGSGTPPSTATFSIAAAPAALTISAPGLSAATTLTFTSKNGLAGSGMLASVTCGTATSQKITCMLTPFALPANGTATALLTVTTTASSSAPASPVARELLLGLLLCLIATPFAMPRKRRLNFAFAAVLFAVAIGGVGCGGAMSSSAAAPNSNMNGTTETGTPRGAIQSFSVPVSINGTTVTVPNLTVTVQ